jgi:pimeloyl-ACP methyl ester carboxylesterase
MFSFLTQVIGLTPDQVSELAAAPRSFDVLAIVANTLAREGSALSATDLTVIPRGVRSPVLLLLGETSPAWAREITRDLAATLAGADVALLPGQGHEAIDAAPQLIVEALERFLSDGASE